MEPRRQSSPPSRTFRLPLSRSYLYVPATKPHLLDKALASASDTVIIDLEDGVPLQRKHEARDNLAALVARPREKPLVIRINGLHTEFASADIEAVAALPVDGIRVPKAEHASRVADVCRRLRALGFSGGMQLLIESAEGVLNLRELAQAHPMIEVLGLGEGDLCTELACEKPYLQPARWQTVLVSRAAGLRRPIQGGHPGLAHSEHFEQTTLEGREAGFFGRIALHPAQVPTINRLYTRCIHEVEYARDALARLDAIIDEGQRTTRDMHGRYLSEWYRVSGERVLQEFEQFGAKASCRLCSGPAGAELAYPR